MQSRIPIGIKQSDFERQNVEGRTARGLPMGFILQVSDLSEYRPIQDYRTVSALTGNREESSGPQETFILTSDSRLLESPRAGIPIGESPWPGSC